MIECDIMKNSKGQALVEFIIILPILLVIIISAIDFGNIISKKYSLENDLDIVVDMYNSAKYDDINNYLSNKDIIIKYDSSDKFNTITLNKNVKIISPVLNLINGKIYKVEASRSIYKNE